MKSKKAGNQFPAFFYIGKLFNKFNIPAPITLLLIPIANSFNYENHI